MVDTWEISGGEGKPPELSLKELEKTEEYWEGRRDFEYLINFVEIKKDRKRIDRLYKFINKLKEAIQAGEDIL